MDVTCERCGTEYEFDETLVAARGTTVKCTQCGHHFKIFRPGASQTAGAPPPGPAEAAAWKLRRGDGRTETIGSLKELQKKISSGDLGRSDELSRDNGGWKRLGDIAELQPFFEAAPAATAGREPTGSHGRVTDRRAYAATAEIDPAALPRTGKSTMMGVGVPVIDEAPPRASRHSNGTAAPRASGDDAIRETEPAGAGTSVPGPISKGRSETIPATRYNIDSDVLPSRPPDRELEPRSVSAASTAAPPAERRIESPRFTRPAGSAGDDETGRIKRAPAPRVDEDDDEPVRRRTSNSGLWVAVVVLIAIGAGVAAGWNRIAPLLGLVETHDPTEPFLVAGEAALALDHEDGYEDAIAQYNRALGVSEHEPRALTGIARARALLAQLRRFEAADLEARAGEDAALRGEAARLRRDAEELAQEAREAAEDAARHAGESGPAAADAEVALADALRLAGDLPRARERLARARSIESVPSGEALRVEALIEADASGSLADARPAAERAVAESPSLLRARLLLARAELAAGNVGVARAQVQAVLDRAAGHPAATSLQARMETGAGTQPAATPSPEASPQPGQPPAPPAAAPAAATTPPSSTAPPPAQPEPAAARETPPETPTPRRDDPESEPSAGGRGYEALVREGDQRLENGDTRRARALYEQALQARPGGSEATTGMGYVMLAEGNVRGAISQFRSAADRGFAEALVGLGDAHRRQGELQEALDAYDRYLARSPNGPHASVARRQSDRLRQQLGAQSPQPAPEPAPAAPPPPEPAPETAPHHLPAPRGATTPPPSDVPEPHD